MDHYHVGAYTELLGTVANTDIDALADTIMTIFGTHFVFGEDVDIGWIWAGSATLNRVRIVAPSLSPIQRTWVRPLENAAIPPNQPNVDDFRSKPLRFRRTEELRVEATSDIAMGTERFTAVLGIFRGRQGMPAGDVFLLRGTATTAAVANAWTEITVTWDDALPQGQYAIIGAVHFSANGIAFSLGLENAKWRPGGLSITDLGNAVWPAQWDGGLGEWGRFNAFIMPRVFVLANAADAVHQVYLQLVRVG